MYHQAQLPVQAELVLPIQQQLSGKRESTIWQQSQKILSHPQALAQSQMFLAKNFPEAILKQRLQQLTRQIHCRTSRITFAAIAPKLSAEMMI